MILYLAVELFKFKAFSVFCEHLTTKRKKHFKLVIIDRFSKLIKTLPMSFISAVSIVNAFVKFKEPLSGPPHLFFFHIGLQLT